MPYFKCIQNFNDSTLVIDFLKTEFLQNKICSFLHKLNLIQTKLLQWGTLIIKHNEMRNFHH